MPDLSTDGSQQRDQAVAEIERLHQLATHHKLAHQRIAELAHKVVDFATPFATTEEFSVVDKGAVDELRRYLAAVEADD